MTVRAIDPLGVTVDYVTATRWKQDESDNTIYLYSFNELVASLPGDWIVNVLPFSQVDPGVEARE